MRRVLSDKFISDLNETDGFLYPILERIRKDHSLMLAIRNDYLNVYYRGGNLLKLTRQSNGSYQSFFDDQYIKSGQSISSLPPVINSKSAAKNCVDSFQELKLAMDFYFSDNNKLEREYQQLVARENNDSTISNESEYFVTDIEFADTVLGARFDILAIRWLATQRKNSANCRAALIEMKYGDKAICGGSGLLDHLKDMDTFIDSDRYGDLLGTIEGQFNQLNQLKLLKFNQSSNHTEIKLDAKDKPEVIFILANHNPRSSNLKKIINDQQMDKYNFSNTFDLRFYVSTFSGYGLHSDCMLTLDEFRKLLDTIDSRATTSNGK